MTTQNSVDEHARPPPLHILLVAAAFDPAHRFGGTIPVNLSLTVALSRLPATRVSVLTTDVAQPRILKRMPVPDGWHRRMEGFDICYCRAVHARGWSWELLRRLPAAVRRADCVHLVSAFDWAVPVTLMLASVYRKPVIWAPQGAIQETMLEQSRPRMKRLWLRGLRWLSRGLRIEATAPSSQEAEAFRRLMPDIPVSLLPHGVMVPSAPPPRPARRNGVLRLVMFSRLVPHKGVDRLLRALVLTRAPTRLDIHGEGPEREALLQLAGELGIAERVRFHGFTPPEKHGAVYAEADLLVLPSIWEPFGMVVLEALAHGVPVLASAGSSWSVLEDVGCGFWRGSNPESLAAALDEAMDRDLAEMGARGRAWVAKAHAWERAARLEADLARRLSGLTSDPGTSEPEP